MHISIKILACVSSYHLACFIYYHISDQSGPTVKAPHIYVGLRANPTNKLGIVITTGHIVEAGLGVVVIAAVTQGVDVPDEAGIRGLFAVSTMHGIVAPRAVGAAAQRDAAGNDDDLWLCADGCTHHSDHSSIFLDYSCML